MMVDILSWIVIGCIVLVAIIFAEVLHDWIEERL